MAWRQKWHNQDNLYERATKYYLNMTWGELLNSLAYYLRKVMHMTDHDFEVLYNAKCCHDMLDARSNCINAQKVTIHAQQTFSLKGISRVC